ncbi:uncharacterized protein N0V89_007622 [Didymosphaeria variabile]|uniref:Uncharacterized protein n=1 Tax=Didymosphaeria variabile TaxID=1932322 RepID=A0A9W8XJ67_9PLEO|nr:uncharacterized protein N0V89_007622 [Didymosphaeria variabile]KAJ4352275.1 hypothetical protein N0V89_007622 [Didymosphaeria variabile]
MPPPLDADAERERRGREVGHVILVCAGFTSEAWAMNTLWRAAKGIEGIHLGWGREASGSDGALILTQDPFPADPLAAWYHCVREAANLSGTICFDVKSGKGPVRYNDIYVVAWPQDIHHIHIVPGPFWYEATTVWHNTKMEEWQWILRQCAVKMEHVPDALRSLVAASKSTRETLSALSDKQPRPPRQWYKNPSNRVEFDGWSVPPPLDITIFTRLSATTKRVSEEAIQRLWTSLEQQPGVRLCENPVKPLIADFILLHTNKQSGRQQQYLIEHKASTSKPQDLRRYMDPKYDWHVLISQSPNPAAGDSYQIALAGDKPPKRLIDESAFGVELAKVLAERGSGARTVVQKRWKSIRRETRAESLGHHRQLDALETGPLDDPRAVDLGGEAGSVADGAATQDPNREWRVANDIVEISTRGQLNDQSWYLGQHVFLPASAANSHGTSILVQHQWSEDEKLAYQTSRILPQPNLDVGVIPLAFGRRLYDNRTGERQYLKASVRRYSCTKIRTVYLFFNSASEVSAVDAMTVHCAEPTAASDCAQCDEEHEHVQWVRGEYIARTMAAGADTHPDVRATIGEYLGSFTLSRGQLWQRCVDLFEQGDTYTVHTLRELLQSTWKHGIRRPKAAHKVAKRWAPCNECWAEERLCDDAQGSCHECLRRVRECSRKRCCFFADPKACENPWCSEVHCTDEYDNVTDVLRDPKGGDVRRKQQQVEVLDHRIPVCDHCWENGWHLLCSSAKVCYMCSVYNKGGKCIRTRCKDPDTCKIVQCYYAHGTFAGACRPHTPREAVTAPSMPADLGSEDKTAIAKERDQTLKTIKNKTWPYYYSWPTGG